MIAVAMYGLVAVALYLYCSAAIRRRVITRRRRAKRYIPLAVRRFVLQRDGGRCRVCGSHDRAEIDHIRPVCRGGKSEPRNLQVLCRHHNRRKAGRW